MGFDALTKVLNRIQQNRSWPIPLEFRQIQQHWEELVGDRVSRNSRPVGLSRNVLWVATINATWSTELQFKRLDLLKKINNRLEAELEDIRFSPGNWYRSALPLPDIDWAEHPSFIGEIEDSPETPKRNAPPKEVFQQWAERMQRRSANLPLCPKCNAPAPAGELERWNECAICFSASRENPLKK